MECAVTPFQHGSTRVFGNASDIFQRSATFLAKYNLRGEVDRLYFEEVPVYKEKVAFIVLTVTRGDTSIRLFTSTHFKELKFCLNFPA
jgi:hypothetical protein